MLPLGLDQNRYADYDYDRVLDIRQRFGKFIVLYIGRLVYYKGCDVLVDAMKELPEATAVLVGAGPLESKLRARIDELGLQDRVHLLGRQSDESVVNLLHASDVFAFPSTQSTECFGLAQVEAMICGKPVINTDLPTGVPWVSPHGVSGLTIKPNSPKELAEAISKMMVDVRMRREFGARARERALKLFTLDGHVARTVERYQELLERRRRREGKPKSASNLMYAPKNQA